MSACTFFGHRDCQDGVRQQVRQIVTELIEAHGVDTFYVGNQGRFDIIVRSVLRELSQKYPHIRYAVVLSSMPADKEESFDTMLPEGIETVHPRYAIDWRNGWMLSRSDYVLACVTRAWGGAAKWAEKAKRGGKKVILISAPL